MAMKKDLVSPPPLRRSPSSAQDARPVQKKHAKHSPALSPPPPNRVPNGPPKEGPKETPNPVQTPALKAVLKSHEAQNQPKRHDNQAQPQNAKPGADPNEYPKPVQKPHVERQKAQHQKDHRHPAPALQTPKLNPRELSLDLPTLWFAADGSKVLPRSIVQKLAPSVLEREINWSNRRRMIDGRWTFVMQLRDPTNLGIYCACIEWDERDPRKTVRARQKYINPPKQPGMEELERWRKKYSEPMARWCESKMGQKVGDGECWALAHDGLKAVGAMRSRNYIHGALVYRKIGTSPAFQAKSPISRGDILQFTSTVFRRSYGPDRIEGKPHHTAIVTKVEGSILNVVHENVGKVKKV